MDITYTSYINIKRRAQTTIVANNNTCSAKYPREVATKLAKNATGPIVLDAFKGQRTRPGKDVPCVQNSMCLIDYITIHYITIGSCSLYFFNSSNFKIA